MSKVSIVLLLQFGLPFVLALSLELLRTHRRSVRMRLVLGVTAIFASLFPLAAYGFVTGHSPHGESVDWYILLCLASFGIVPFGVFAAVCFVTSAIVEPLTGLLRSDSAGRNSSKSEGGPPPPEGADAE